jgi:hypothetical protein
MLTPVFVLAQSLTLCAPLATQPQLGAVGDPVAIVAIAESGSVSPSVAFNDEERAQLRAAQQQAPDLAALRAGSGPTDEDWKWIAIGALAVVVLIIIF